MRARLLLEQLEESLATRATPEAVASVRGDAGDDASLAQVLGERRLLELYITRIRGRLAADDPAAARRHADAAALACALML